MATIFKDKLWLIGSLIVTVSWLLVAFAKVHWFDTNGFAQYSTAFNALGTLFTGLTLSFLIWTAFMQRTELNQTVRALTDASISQAQQVQSQMELIEIQKNMLRLSVLPRIKLDTCWGQQLPSDTNQNYEFFFTFEVSISPIFDVSSLKLQDNHGNEIESKISGSNNFDNQKFHFKFLSDLAIDTGWRGFIEFKDILENDYFLDLEIIDSFPSEDHIDFSVTLFPPQQKKTKTSTATE